MPRSAFGGSLDRTRARHCVVEGTGEADEWIFPFPGSGRAAMIGGERVIDRHFVSRGRPTASIRCRAPRTRNRHNNKGATHERSTPLVKGRIENAPGFGGVVCTF